MRTSRCGSSPTAIASPFTRVCPSFSSRSTIGADIRRMNETLVHRGPDGEGTAVADAKSLSGDAAEIRLAAGRAVERHVANEDVVLGDEARVLRWKNDQLSAGQSFADVVVRIAFQEQR